MRVVHGRLVLLLLLAAAAGCQHGKPDPLTAYKREQARKQQALAAESASEKKVAGQVARESGHQAGAVAGGAPPLDPAVAARDPFLRTQLDVELNARWITPGILQLTVMNKTDKPLAIGPECFGLILPPEKKVHDVLPAARKTFPAIKLGPGEQASGQLIFTAPPADTPESRLVFRHPEARPAMARIE